MTFTFCLLHLPEEQRAAVRRHATAVEFPDDFAWAHARKG